MLQYLIDLVSTSRKYPTTSSTDHSPITPAYNLITWVVLIYAPNRNKLDFAFILFFISSKYYMYSITKDKYILAKLEKKKKKKSIT